MFGLKTPLAHAQEVKAYLLEHELFDKRYRIVRQGNDVIFPVNREFTPPFDFDVEFLTADGEERVQLGSLREALKSKLTIEEYDELRASYDIVGSIAIIEVPDLLLPKETLIAETLLQVNKTVKTVLKKASGHEGIYRTQRMTSIAGEDTRETIVVENGARLKVNVETAYYSVRMATERKRILQLIKPDEHVLCLFSGIGPYPVIFSMYSPAASIVGVEINPAGHELALANVAKNRCTNVRLMCADAHDAMRKFEASGEKFDRVTMPLPHTAHEFLNDVMRVVRSGATIHFYTFLEEGAFNNSVQQMREIVERHGFTLARYDVVRVGQHSPRVWRICLDATVV